MARRTVDPKDREAFWAALREGRTMADAARTAGISYETAKAWKRKALDKHTVDTQQKVVAESAGGKQRRLATQDIAQAEMGGPVPYALLSPNAKRAYHDFGFFRRYYLGRGPTPWQEEAGKLIAEHLESDEREFVVMNMPPGAGKSTLMHDVAVWCIVRNRSVRILIGSISKPLADQYAHRIRNTLERTQPIRPDAEAVRKGLAVDAEGCLARDFGRFKPLDKGGLWRRDEFVVEQLNDEPLDNKEPTVSAYGIDSEFIGHRADLVLYDDVVNPDNAREGAQRDRLIDKWDSQAEARCEPGGALFLVGQRLAPTDLYHYCINKKWYDEDALDEDGNPVEHVKYKHIKYQAYYPELDAGPDSRKPSAPAWPNGPLLDPQRLPWRDINQIRQATPVTFDIVYQQEDTDAALSLVQRVWAMGGVDKDTGITYLGCIDHGRLPRQFPRDLPSGQTLSICTVDPSPTEYWGIQWWLRPVADPAQRRFLIDLERRRQTAEELLGFDTTTGEWVGLMEEWQQASEMTPHRITHWVIEINAAQRFLLAHDYVRKWCQARRVHIVPHTTSNNKMDSARGIEALVPHLWRHGQVRLPDFSSWKSQALINEVCSWKPDKKKGTDLVMAHWFAELHWPGVQPPKRPKQQWRPTFMKEMAYA